MIPKHSCQEENILELSGTLNFLELLVMSPQERAVEGWGESPTASLQAQKLRPALDLQLEVTAILNPKFWLEQTLGVLLVP